MPEITSEPTDAVSPPLKKAVTYLRVSTADQAKRAEEKRAFPSLPNGRPTPARRLHSMR